MSEIDEAKAIIGSDVDIVVYMLDATDETTGDSLCDMHNKFEAMFGDTSVKLIAVNKIDIREQREFVDKSTGITDNPYESKYGTQNSILPVLLNMVKLEEYAGKHRMLVREMTI